MLKRMLLANERLTNATVTKYCHKITLETEDYENFVLQPKN